MEHLHQGSLGRHRCDKRGQFVKFLTLESDVVSGEGHRQKRSKS